MSVKRSQPGYSYEIYIGVDSERVWQGLVDEALTRQYVYGTRFHSTLEKGAPYAYLGEQDFSVVDGEILDAQPGRRLAMTWNAHWDDAVNADPPSRVTFEIQALGPAATRLQVVHDGFASPEAEERASLDGWVRMLSSLKSLLESGKPLSVE